MSGVADFFYKEAQRHHYVARSAFKLLQLQDKYKLIKPGAAVLDLGCAPGAWLQVACQKLGSIKNGGVVVGIDLKKVKIPTHYCDARVKTVCADVRSLPRDHIRSLSPKKAFTVILSDMCPLVSGIKNKDAALSAELGMRALDLAVGSRSSVEDQADNKDLEKEGDGSLLDQGGILSPGGSLVIKLLESDNMQEFNQICKPLFRKASWLRPKATRPSSREIYLICQGLRA